MCLNTKPSPVARWVARLQDRKRRGFARPLLRTLSSPSQIPLATAETVEILRRQRRTQEHIAAELGISPQPASRASSGRAAGACSRPWSRNCPGHATSARSPARSSASTSRKHGRFGRIGHRLLQRPRCHRRARADRQWHATGRRRSPAPANATASSTSEPTPQTPLEASQLAVENDPKGHAACVLEGRQGWDLDLQ